MSPLMRMIYGYRPGDKDLQSIEVALNNLLARMQESKLQQARFVSDASHELRTPISVIQGYVNMLDRWGKEDEAVLNESIEALKNESDHMKDLIEQLLFLARGDSGRNTLKPVEVDLNDLVQEVYEESMMIDETHPYEFSACPGCMVRGDVAMLKQSIRIFVQNAAKYSEGGDTIHLQSGGQSKASIIRCRMKVSACRHPRSCISLSGFIVPMRHATVRRADQVLDYPLQNGS